MFAGAILAASLALTPAQATKVDALVRQVMQADHIPGLSLGIARNGRVLYTRGYGFRSLLYEEPADARTIYRIGSITKQFTAALILQEIERGDLQLGSESGGYTIAQLLAQTSGLVSYTDPGQTIQTALSVAPHFPAGTQWEYSNTNYYLLGNVLESVSHQSYADLLEQRIIAPLHLRATSFAREPGNDIASGYAWNGTAIVPATADANDDPAVAYSASALSSNVVDLLAWLAALQHGMVISQDDFHAMTTSATLDDGTPTHYGYGFYIEDWYGWPVAQHPGFMDGYCGDDAISLRDGLELVVLSNADKTALVPLVKSIFAMVDPPIDTSLVATPAQPPKNEDPNTTALVRVLATQLERVQPLGILGQSEFLESTQLAGIAYSTYRLTFDAGQYVMKIGLRNGKVVSLTFEPAQ